MAKYKIIYYKIIGKEEYNKIKDSLPSHKIESPLTYNYWVGGKTYKKEMVLEIIEPIYADHRSQAIAIVQEWINQGKINPKATFRLYENDKIKYTEADFTREDT